jgi:twitching motility protein PilI
MSSALNTTHTPAVKKADSKVDSAARRTRMREFQAQLLERMQAAKSGTDVRISQLGVVTEASEIVSVGNITPIPLTHDWYLGLSNIRGNLLSVIDFARFQGQAQTPITSESRIIAFAPALSFNSGLLVSRVLGLRNIIEMELLQEETVPEVGPASSNWATHRFRDRELQLWQRLDLSLVVQDPRFLHVGL